MSQSDNKTLDECKVSICVAEGATLKFANPNVYMLMKTHLGGREQLVKSAEYLGEGKWMIKESVDVKKVQD